MWSQNFESRSPGPTPRPPSTEFTEFDLVVLRVERPELGLRAGDVGTVLSVRGALCHVEFGAPGGAWAGVLSVRPSALRPVGPDELFHVRTLEPPVRVQGA